MSTGASPAANQIELSSHEILKFTQRFMW